MKSYRSLPMLDDDHLKLYQYLRNSIKQQWKGVK